MSKNILQAAIVIGIIVISFLVAWPVMSSILGNNTEQEKIAVLGNLLSLKPAKELSIVQGYSDTFLTLTNNSNEYLSFNLGHAHGHLALEPRSAILQPGASQDITVQIDDFCPSGKVELLLFILAESETESFGMETANLEFEVLPGTLGLTAQNNNIIVIWNDNPAPPGVLVFYRDPTAEEKNWKLWGETPNLNPPGNLRTGIYSFEFKARLSNVESAVENLEIFIEQAETGFQPQSVPSASAQTKSTATQPQASSEPDSGDLVYVVKEVELPEGNREPATVTIDPGPRQKEKPLDLF
jgi:hypothetical protein